MSSDPLDLMPPRILVVDDETQIHASMRLRLAGENELVFSSSGPDALLKIADQRFDLCFADIHMPEMDGLRFIDTARTVDPCLGYVVLSAFDTDDNLRRTIPLQVYDFISKPLPERHDFEGRISGWVEATRKRRREHVLADHANMLATERDSARMERDIELVASESTRDALLQTAALMTTVDAHFLSACSVLAARVKTDPTLNQLHRAMLEGRRATAAVMNVTDRVLGSAYGSRDSSPALINEGIRDAINLALKGRSTEELNKAVSFVPVDAQLPIRGLSGISFLLMVFPALAATLALTAANNTVGIRGEHYPRLDAILKDPKLRSYLWLNRRNAFTSQPAWLIVFSSTAPALGRIQAEQWLQGEYAELAAITPRGIIEGVRKCHGLLGFSVTPTSQFFRLCLALPA
jgi:CheY-like chemotaxis protein